MSVDTQVREKVARYLARAHQASETGRLVLEHEDYVAAVNRAYYAIFYAANAMLTTKGLERRKDSGVIAAFRQHFVKTGIIEPEFSRSYGATMDEQNATDGNLVSIDYEIASRHLTNASQFLSRIECALQEQDLRIIDLPYRNST